MTRGHVANPPENTWGDESTTAQRCMRLNGAYIIGSGRKGDEDAGEEACEAHEAE